MNHVYAAAGERVEGGGFTPVHRVGQIFEQILAGECLVGESSIEEIEDDKRDASGGRVSCQRVAEFVGIVRARKTTSGTSDLFEGNDFLLGSVLEHGEVFLLKAAEVSAGFVGHQGWNQHQFGASGELDLRVVFLFLLVFIFAIGADRKREGKCQANEQDEPGMPRGARHFRTPFELREQDADKYSAIVLSKTLRDGLILPRCHRPCLLYTSDA